VAEFVMIIFNKYMQIGENYFTVDSDRFLPQIAQFIIAKFGAV
jgi:hypothetical protein